MKKTIAMILVLAGCMTLAGCAQNEENQVTQVSAAAEESTASEESAETAVTEGILSEEWNTNTDGAPFLTLLFEKEVEQVPFIPMPASLKAVTASSKTAVKATAKGVAKTTAKTTAKMTAIKGTAIGMTPNLLNLEGGCVRYCTYHLITEDTYEERDQLYYDTDGF